MAETQYFCKKPQRRAQVLAAVDGQGHPLLNGIDFLEVYPNNQTTLTVHFLFNLPGGPNGVPGSPAPALVPANFVVEGGTRITGIKVVSAVSAGSVLTLQVNEAGDFSMYTLKLVYAAGFDPQLSAIEFSFKAGCPSDFDCKTTSVCPPARFPEPEIDYLAKDYASFRRLILDRMAVTIPEWTERSPADIGVALAELLAYAGDQLSYYQDAVGTEAYLGTARRRVSVRRHARLLDYRLHEGCNARSWVFFESGATGGVLPKGTMLLTLANAPRGPIGPIAAAQALSQGAEAFETLAGLTVHAEFNRIRFYTWSDQQCCLPRGATRATLLDEGAGPLLKAGDLLLLEEVLGPATGSPVDADPQRRHVLRLTEVALSADPLNGSKLIEIGWDAADALPVPFCLSAVLDDHVIEDLTIARGNLVLADHGLTQPEEELPDVTSVRGFYRPTLENPGLTFRAPYDDFAARSLPASGVLLQEVRQTLPDLTVAEGAVLWHPQQDLLRSGHNATDFVVEMEQDGTACLRFGDGVLGAKPGSGLTADYRTGNGAAGNVGAEAIAHVVVPDNTLPPDVKNVRNPVAAAGGTDAESLEDARRAVPWAFRTQERAVTAADYAMVARRDPEVRQAEATLRWTGSWYTMFLTVDRAGGKPVDAAFGERVRNFLERYRMAGYDLEVEAPLFVPLDILFSVCVTKGYFRSNVKAALLDVFSNRDLSNGGRGFFHPDRFTFGQPVYLSQMVAAAMRIPGVAWVDTSDIPPKANRFRRLGQKAQGEIAAGRIAMDRLEIARLDNDPNDPENGCIQFVMEGGI